MHSRDMAAAAVPCSTVCVEYCSARLIHRSDDDLSSGINSIGTDYGAQCDFYNRYSIHVSYIHSAELMGECRRDCGMESGGVQMLTVSDPGCSELPSAEPAVNSWEGAVDCLILGSEAVDLCVLR